jgi:hypothetical protein
MEDQKMYEKHLSMKPIFDKNKCIEDIEKLFGKTLRDK